MTVSLQVLYPVTKDSIFDFDYYTKTHLGLVGQHMGPHIASTVIVKSESGDGGGPAAFHAVATILFEDQTAFEAAMAVAGPVVADIPEFYNGEPQMLVGNVLG